MFTTDYRPKRYRSVIGQDLAVELLKSIAKSPERMPKSLLLYGTWGTGKTTMARLFGKSLVCEKFQKEGEICLKCPACRDFDKVSSHYLEFDSSVVGNKQDVQDLKYVIDLVTDTFRVIVFDEVHVASSAAQNALLKQIEEGPIKTFFLFCTTEIDKVIKTIQSRCLHIEFFKVQDSLIVERLKQIITHEKLEAVSEELLYKIALKADGHVRDAIMCLNGFVYSRDESLIHIPVDFMKDYLFYISKGSVELAQKTLKSIMQFPLYEIHRSFNYSIGMLTKAVFLKEDNGYEKIATVQKINIIKILRLVSEAWVQAAFKDEYLAYSFLLSFIHLGKV